MKKEIKDSIQDIIRINTVQDSINNFIDYCVQSLDKGNLTTIDEIGDKIGDFVDNIDLTYPGLKDDNPDVQFKSKFRSTLVIVLSMLVVERKDRIKAEETIIRHRQQDTKYWSKQLREILNETFEDGTSIIEFVLVTNPILSKNLKAVLNKGSDT